MQKTARALTFTRQGLVIGGCSFVSRPFPPLSSYVGERSLEAPAHDYPPLPGRGFQQVSAILLPFQTPNGSFEISTELSPSGKALRRYNHSSDFHICPGALVTRVFMHPFLSFSVPNSPKSICVLPPILSSVLPPSRFNPIP